MRDEVESDKFDGEAAAPAVSWLRDRLLGAGPYLPPIIAALVVIGLFGVYYLVHVRVRRDYLVNRNFRALAILGDQIQGNIGNHIDVLWSFANEIDPRERNLDHGRAKANIMDFREEDGDEKDYMHFLAPDLKLGITLGATKRDRKVQVPKLQVRRQRGRWELVMAACGPSKIFTGTVGLEELFRPFVGSAPFENVLLAAEDGSIIYQKAKTGPQFVNLTALLQSQAEEPDQKHRDADPAEKNTGDDGSLIQSNESQQWQKRPLHLTEITIAGVRYQLFLQPVLIDVFHEDYLTKRGNVTAGDDSEDTGAIEKPREWVLCGLIPSATLQWQSLAVSYEFMIWMTVGFLAVLLGAPLLKLLFLNKREHLHLRECFTAGFSLALLTALTTFAGLQAIYFTFGDSDQGQAELRNITSAMTAEIQKQLEEMHQQLISFCRHSWLRDDLQDLQKDKQQIYRLGINKQANDKDSPMREAVKSPAWSAWSNAFWTDDDGHQLIKWSGSDWATPMIDLAELDLFKNLEEENLAEHPLLYLGDVPQRQGLFHFDSTLAPNKVEYLAAMGMKTSDCVDSTVLRKMKDRDVAAGRAFLISKPFSLIDSVLPLGYGFALVDANGKVLFHSDKTRNTRENFLEESDSNRELYSALLGGETDRPLQIQYFGKDYLVDIGKIPNLREDGRERSLAPLSLIVYRDLTHVRTLNLETAAISSILFLFLLVPPALVVASLYIIRRPRYIAEPFWPHQERISAYAYQTAIGILFSLVLLLICWNAKSQDRLIDCGILLYGALFFTYWAFWLKCAECPGAGGRRSHGRTLTAAVFTTVFAGWAVRMASGHQMTRLVWLVPAFAICGLPLYGPVRTALNEKVKLWTSRAWFPAWRVWHTASLASLLLLVGVTVPLTLFRATLRVERRLQDKRETLYREEAEQRREALFRNSCEVNDILPEDCNPDSSTWSFARPSGAGDSEADPLSHGFSRLFYSLHHNYNPTAAENLAMLSDDKFPAPTIPDNALIETAFGGLIIVLASLLVWRVGGKLFLLDAAWPEKYSEKVRATAVGSQSATASWEASHPAAGAPLLSGLLSDGGSGPAEELAREPAFEDHGNESLVIEALETQAPHYKELWSGSSEDEKFVLTQLASDGLLNPLNAEAIRSLVRRGLIVRKPQFQIMNESFRRFVLGRPSVEVRHRWLAESRKSGWGKLSGVFTTVVILVAVFLLATQNSLWESAAAYVTTALGGLGTMLKLLHLVRGEKAS